MTFPAYMQPSEVFDTYIRFACERQAIFMKRVRGEAPPWTTDPVLATHRFTNPYRASDRVSQALIAMQYAGPQDADNLFWRVMLFKMFNKVDTWRLIQDDVFGGREPEWRPGVSATIADVFDDARARGEAVYNPAYMMPEPDMGQACKHRNHLALLDKMMADGMPEQAQRTATLEALYKLLRAVPSLGPFLAFQYAIDLNYSTLVNHDEMSFVVAGPGAKSGIQKCFPGCSLSPEHIIRTVAMSFDEECTRRGVAFEKLGGRPLQLIDVQNLACETDKVSRIKHPGAKGNGRTEIKAKYDASSPRPIPQWYPPKWGVRLCGARAACSDCGEMGDVGMCAICGARIS